MEGLEGQGKTRRLFPWRAKLMGRNFLDVARHLLLVSSDRSPGRRLGTSETSTAWGVDLKLIRELSNSMFSDHMAAPGPWTTASPALQHVRQCCLHVVLITTLTFRGAMNGSRTSSVVSLSRRQCTLKRRSDHAMLFGHR